MEATGGIRSFRINRTREESAPLVLGFHRENQSEYIWPRTLAEFEDLIRNECLYEVSEITGEDALVGICYLKRDEGPAAVRDEFGGICIDDSCRGLGLASVLGLVAISDHFVWDPPPGKLISHVHEDNDLPRSMLEKRLGFVRVGREIPPCEAVPQSMKRNRDGQVVADLYEFERSMLLDFADWIKGFEGELLRKGVRSRLRIDLSSIAAYRRETITALRALGNRT